MAYSISSNSLKSSTLLSSGLNPAYHPLETTHFLNNVQFKSNKMSLAEYEKGLIPDFKGKTRLKAIMRAVLHQLVDGESLNENSCVDVKDKLLVVLVPKNYPRCKLIKDHVDELATQLVAILDSIEPGVGLEPIFDGYTYSSGACILKCESEPTKNWVINQVVHLIVGEEIRLVAVGPEVFLKYITAEAFFPNAASPEIIISRLKLQNPNAEVEKWSIEEILEEPGGKFIILRFPGTTLPFLQASQFKVLYCLDQVSINIITGKEEQILGKEFQNVSQQADLLKKQKSVDKLMKIEPFSIIKKFRP